MVGFLFFSLMVTPKTNFIIADFWRWMVVHMWVEVTFEVFTTVIVGFLYAEMGLVSRHKAEAATYIAVMLFFLTATLGVAHNFYWIAKPTGVIALGSTVSTTQVLPLILLSIDAWKKTQMTAVAKDNQKRGLQKHVMHEVYLYLLGVNFWNVVGAGVLGSMINLPIVNYYEHATNLTGNHSHAAMFGVKGNLALAGLLFCAQHLIKNENWSPRLIRVTFWSLNGGIALMMMLSLFPTGMYQFVMNLRYGFHYARSLELLHNPVFKTLLKARAIGGHTFINGGLIPLVYFICTRNFMMKENTPPGKLERSWWLDNTGKLGGKENKIE
jgi:nitric oxide reductase subunit B